MEGVIDEVAIFSEALWCGYGNEDEIPGRGKIRTSR